MKVTNVPDILRNNLGPLQDTVGWSKSLTGIPCSQVPVLQTITTM